MLLDSLGIGYADQSNCVGLILNLAECRDVPLTGKSLNPPEKTDQGRVDLESSLNPASRREMNSRNAGCDAQKRRNCVVGRSESREAGGSSLCCVPILW